ncbi:MAG: hypothetical protein ACP5O0_03240 [Acidimicrobiales bacterium]
MVRGAKSWQRIGALGGWNGPLWERFLSVVLTRPLDARFAFLRSQGAPQTTGLARSGWKVAGGVDDVGRLERVENE